MDFLFCDGIFVFEEFLHQGVVVFGNRLDQLGAVLLYFGFHFGGDVNHVEGGAHIVLMPYDGPVFHQVDHAFEIGLVSDGEHDRHSVGFQHVAHLLAHSQEVGALAVHLVDKAHTGNLVVVSQAPVGLRLGLYPIYGAEQEHQPVKNPQGAVYLYGKIHVAGGVDDIEVIRFGLFRRLSVLQREVPGTGGGRRSNGDATLLLLLHPVHGSSPVVHFADLVADPGVEEDPFRSSGLAGIDVRGNTDIPCIF